MRLFTIGFTRKSAQQFFETLRASGARRIIDVRLNNLSQLAGFSKRGDLKYFLRALCGMDYRHCLELAPTEEMLHRYQRGDGGWDAYEHEFLELLEERRVETLLASGTIHEACLLCSETRPDFCHRRLVAEFLARHHPQMRIEHLG